MEPRSVQLRVYKKGCLEMSKIVKYGDFFLDVTKQRRIRNMRREVREDRIKAYIKRAEKELPLFEGDK